MPTGGAICREDLLTCSSVFRPERGIKSSTMKVHLENIYTAIVRTAAICFFILIAAVPVKAQNVSNPDFELTPPCPTTYNTGSGYTIPGWTIPTGGTADFFRNVCYMPNIDFTTDVVSPVSGNSFIGIIVEQQNLDYKEYLTNTLSAPLVAGTVYNISFYIRSNNSGLLLNKESANATLPVAERGYFGLMFSTTAPTTANTTNGWSGSISNTFAPTGRVYIPASNTAAYTSATWTLVTLSYTATGGEQYMTIGQFRPGTSTLTPVDPYGKAYFFIDGVSNVLPALNPSLSKSVSPSTIVSGGTATYTFTISNTATGNIAQTALSFTDALPSGLRVAAIPNVTVTGLTGGTTTATAGGTSVGVSGYSIAAGATGTITVDVTNAAGQSNATCPNPAFTNAASNVTGTSANLTNNIGAGPCLTVLAGCKPTGSTVTFTPGTNNTAAGYTTAYILTDAAGTIVNTNIAPAGFTSPLLAGTYTIYSVNFTGTMIGNTQNSNISGVTSSTGCAAKSSASFCVISDSDGDGIADSTDLDDDNDGILDTVECTPTHVFANLASATIANGNAATATVSGIVFGGITGTLTRANNGTTVVDVLTKVTDNFSNASLYTPAGSTTEGALSEGLGNFNGTTNFTKYTLTLSAPVESVTLHINNWDFMRTRFTGNHVEQLLSGGTELVYNPAVRQLYDTDPNSNSVPARDGFGSVRITSTNGLPFSEVIFEKFDDPNTASSPDGFRYTFSIEPICDVDGDGIPNQLDLDSDNDGCLDAIEGDENVQISQLVTAAGTVNVGTGSTASNQNLCASASCVDSQGVPTLVNTGATADIGGDQGQGIGTSQNNLISGCITNCYKPGVTSGTVLDTPHGITALGRAGTEADNWPMVRKGAWTALEAKTKGFVINRVAFNASGNPVGIPSANYIEGMMVYDTTNQCLKIYTSTDNGATYAWSCVTTQTCPD